VLHKKGKGVWTWITDSFLLFAFATFLVQPLYHAEYLNVWNSIESTFISDARFLREHWPHPQWQPNWYTGTRWDYIYPPALRYGTAALSLVRHSSTARSYHLYIALLFALGIAGVYVFVRAGSGSRWTAAWTAIAAAVVSPGFLLFPDIGLGYAGLYYMPIRLGVLIRYGEGPHMSAFALLPFALAAAWKGVRRGHPGRLAIAAVFAAAVVSHNFYGATALAMLFPVLVWSVWLAERDLMVWARAAAVAALACCLCAFWLTPSYLRVTIYNMRWVSSPGHAWSVALAAALAIVYAALSWKLVRGRPERAWACFVIGALTMFAVDVVGQHYYDFRVFGEPARLVPELELTILMGTALLFAWISGYGRWARAGAVVLAVASLSPGLGYVRHCWKVLPPRDDYRNRIEFQLTNWIAANIPGVRTYATGSVRFWYNAWHDLPELGGGSDQGLLNENEPAAQYGTLVLDDVDRIVLWLKAMGTGAITVHDKRSQEVYHDFAKPEKFEGKLDTYYDDGAGNRIYRIPLRYPEPARVVDATAMRAIPWRPQADMDILLPYVAAVEHGPEARVGFEAPGPDSMQVRARLAPGQLVMVQQAYDPAWKCYDGSRRVSVTRDAIGFLLLDPGPGDHDLLLRFETPLENRLGAALSVIGLLAVAAMAWRSARLRDQ
jgi:hypothetical protein